MALGTYTQFYAQSGGSVMNGGSDSNNAAAYTSTNGNWDGTSIFTPTDGSTPASSVTVGQFASVYLDGATTPVYFARVTAVAAGVNGAITLSTTSKSGTAPTSGATGRSIKVGGAWGLPSGATSFPIVPLSGFAALTDASGNLPKISFKSTGTGGIDCAMTGAMSNGVNGPYVMEGYKTSVGDGATNADTQANQVNYKLRIDGSTNAIVLLTVTGSQIRMDDFQFTNNGTTGSSNGLTFAGTSGLLNRIIVHDVRGAGIRISGTGIVSHECETYACNTSNTDGLGGVTINNNPNFVFNLTSHHNTGTNNCGIVFVAGASMVESIISDNGRDGASILGSAIGVMFQRCDFYNNGVSATGAGININTTTACVTSIEDCNFENNGQTSGTGYGIRRQDSNADIIVLWNCGFYNNKTSATNGLSMADDNGTITNSASQYTDPANGNFTLNSGQTGAKNSGRGAFTQTKASWNGTVGYPDTLAAQHLDSGGGGGSQRVIGG